ncbi:membrane protein [Paraclostridium ghonii]|uniref:Membrane protein YczE n=1 Tax=Paraclostridium ghonii TaxID=29358 RepID=A0ABU0MZR1_9FIRM|nr:membrane protein [Paeniclostridium ghonii]MDQ0556402.1 putative membrane protein YczE [Paeniclostridium ghonii]
MSKAMKSKKVTMMLIGILILGMGVALCNIIGLGVDPFAAMNIGISKTTSISLGISQMSLNILIFIVLYKFSKHLMGLGTFFNMMGLGYVVEFFSNVYSQFVVIPNNLFIKFALLGLAFIMIGIGLSLYYTANLGLAPYDCIPIILSKKTKFEFGICRVFADCICVVIALIFGGNIGVSTLIIACGMGPTVQFFNRNFSEKLLDKRENKDTAVFAK